MERRVSVLESILGFSVSVISSEHFFSTFLSSPLTVQTLYRDKEEDRKTVLHSLYLAIVVSVGFGALISLWLKDWWALIGALGTSLLYWIIYIKALRGEL